MFIKPWTVPVPISTCELALASWTEIIGSSPYTVNSWLGSLVPIPTSPDAKMSVVSNFPKTVTPTPEVCKRVISSYLISTPPLCDASK